MQISRLFEIVYLLIERQTITAKELSEHFEVNTRTIYRDIECLCQAGIPIYMTRGRSGGISIMPQFILNKLLLTEAEKTEIIASMKAFTMLRFDAPTSALGKVSSLLGETEQSDWVEIEFATWTASDIEKQMFVELKRCILTKNLCEICYSDIMEDETTRMVEPLKLCFRSGGWYLYAYCRLREDYRFFKLSRIFRLETLNESFVRTAPRKVFDDEKYNFNMTYSSHIKGGMLNSNNKEVSIMEQNYENMKFCQSCGMPLTEEFYGTEKDGNKNEDYCSYCYKNGDFTAKVTMEQMIEFCVGPMVQSNPQMTEEQARQMMREFFPNLKRWK